MATTMTLRIRTLTGELREWDEVFARCGRAHSTDEIAGYVVRRTFPDEPHEAHEDVRSFGGATNYGDALACVERVRAESERSYGVIDFVYADGCRAAA